jgi:hypothetical protein
LAALLAREKVAEAEAILNKEREELAKAIAEHEKQDLATKSAVQREELAEAKVRKIQEDEDNAIWETHQYMVNQFEAHNSKVAAFGIFIAAMILIGCTIWQMKEWSSNDLPRLDDFEMFKSSNQVEEKKDEECFVVEHFLQNDDDNYAVAAAEDENAQVVEPIDADNDEFQRQHMIERREQVESILVENSADNSNFESL